MIAIVIYFSSNEQRKKVAESKKSICRHGPIAVMTSQIGAFRLIS